jgi:rubredoxin
MARRYCIVFLGLIEQEEQFTTFMSSRCGVPAGTVKDILDNAPVTLKKNLSLKEARAYAEAVQTAGGRVHIREEGASEEPERARPSMEIRSFGDFTLCPECGFTQLKSEACVKCGFSFSPENGRRNLRRDGGC